MKDQERVSKIIDALAPELKTLALNIHDNPELGLQEFKACAWQKELLTKYGFQIEDHFCNLETAYKAVYKGKKQGPKIAFLAEYDALPGLGHGCGHNLIAMVAVGCGIACREFADKYGAEIDVIGTPAEETAGTKVPMSAMGVFKDYDAVMMAHPMFSNTDCFNSIAMDAYQIEFFGKPAHAANTPYEGINALDAMINFFNLINAMRQETKPDARIHGIITDGGKAASVLFMLVGGSSGSTAGGLKTVTFVVLLLFLWARLRGKSTVCAFRRTIPDKQVLDAMTIATAMVLLAFFGAVFICATSPVSFVNALFEAVSALATVGLTAGTTGSLSVPAQCLIILYMYFGRVGVLTISLGFLSGEQAMERFRYAQTNLLIG